MSGYIGATPVPQSIQTKQTFTATASQTTFGTTGYSDGTLVDVHLNGVLLVGGGVDYTATNGSDIVLTTGASAGDTLEFSTFSALQLSDQVFNNSITLQNPTEEDTEGGRESTLIFKGEQSGGEKTTLAEIEASHDGTSDDQKGDLIFRTNDGSDGSAPTEAARIDSAQNLLVGKTALDVSQEGVYLSSGQVGASKSGIPFLANRLSSDGDIASFRKDGTTVGSIGVASSDNFYIGGTASNHGGILFNDTGGSQPAIQPCSVAGTLADASVNLGSSGNRFENLYLSGGVVLDDNPTAVTGSVTSKTLDDYEEGLHTVTISPGTSGTLTLYSTSDTFSYTKIGRMVHVNGWVQIETNSSAVGTWVNLSLPFVAADLQDVGGRVGGAQTFNDASGPNTVSAKGAYVTEGSFSLQVFIDASTLANGDDFIIDVNYNTT